MPAEQLQHWAPRVEAALRALPARARSELGALAGPAQASARARARVLTGAYRDSLSVTADGDQLRIASDHPRAQSIEDGGIARGTPWVAVPLTPSARAAGSPRADAGLFSVRLKDGRLFLASKASGFLELRWRLAPAVVTRRTGVLRETSAEAAQQFASRIGPALVDEVVL